MKAYLEGIGGVGRGKNDLSVTDGERIISRGLGEDPNSRLSCGGTLLVFMVVKERWEMGTIGVMPFRFDMFMLDDRRILSPIWRLLGRVTVTR